ncbi:HNH endonuclease [Stutzerimonas xanthomarina]|uniref:HNH endonuclease n=1 Tax=Stutzerimonas xanthomarina TaxID=271420 RepID=UPI00190AE70D|nr:HNH endonuclease signature motif containing protein [Stutzerimonas xanthomarina]
MSRLNKVDVDRAIEAAAKMVVDLPYLRPARWHVRTSEGELLPMRLVYRLATNAEPVPSDAPDQLRRLGFQVVRIGETSESRSFWWVNHKQTHRVELEGGYIWSPKENQNGARNQTYINLTLVRPGDLVISYAGAEIRAIGVATGAHQEKPKPKAFGQAGQNWSEIGWFVPVEWSVLSKAVSPKSYLDRIVDLLPAKNSPLQRTGNGNQGCYLASISSDLGSLILSLTRTTDAAAVDRVMELEDQLKADELEQVIQGDVTLSPTEREQLIRSRVGQGAFRVNVMEVEKACRLTGIADGRFLIASHIKPWRESKNEERLDGYNGLMLAPHVDKLFDRGWISFADNGDLLIASETPVSLLSSWGIEAGQNVGAFSAKQQAYLLYHREFVFRGPLDGP